MEEWNIRHWTVANLFISSFYFSDQSKESVDEYKKSAPRTEAWDSNEMLEMLNNWYKCRIEQLFVHEQTFYSVF